jgi:DNA-binding transcriptional ArsR family regulator
MSNMPAYEHQANLVKALSHPTRLAILELLRKDEACVCHLEATLGCRQAHISQQLMILREAGLVQDRREGSNVYYRVAEPGVFAVIDALRRLDGSAGPAPRARPADCPCPKCATHAAARRG